MTKVEMSFTLLKHHKIIIISLKSYWNVDI
jgi:hypothetical protein